MRLPVANEFNQLRRCLDLRQLCWRAENPRVRGSNPRPGTIKSLKALAFIR
jgi:hypothetical protein